MHRAVRYHDISCGHRVVGHEGKCQFLHGHNYRIHFICEANLLPASGAPKNRDLDKVGRVVDFSVIKEKLCMWVEKHFDHHFLIWSEDPDLDRLRTIDPTVVVVPFNPTAENIARYLVVAVAPAQLEGLPVRCTKVIVEETRKCSAEYEVF
jgi:6-pyruvoyltetrahydropterin/6-carboxytetrahydropterin synthase